MSCQDYRDALAELVDGTIAPEARRTLEAHLATCQACRVEARDLQRIREAAAALPPSTPPLTLWPRLASRLKAAGVRGTESPVTEGPPARSGLGAWLLGSPLRAASLAAAAVLVLAVATVLFLFRPAPVGPGATVAGRAPATQGQAAPVNAAVNANAAQDVESIVDELKLAETHYQNAISGLEQIKKSGEGALDPQVAQTLQRNLDIIDQAIRDSKTALAQQPTSQLAQDSLFEAFRRKVALLQDTISLINEMRKGNQAGAAEIIKKAGRS
jgi:anti-sigma factor RsiW